jgi:hypothetical protein
MAKFPHEFTMKKYHLIETDLNQDASDALNDFEEYLAYLVDLKERAGDDWVMNADQKRKINRLSRAVCTEIEYMVDDEPEIAENVEEPQEEVAQEEYVEPEPEDDDTGGILGIFGL